MRAEQRDSGTQAAHAVESAQGLSPDVADPLHVAQNIVRVQLRQPTVRLLPHGWEGA